MNVNVRVKICCIGSLAEARCALEAGADALGLVSEMPSGPGVISESEIASVVAALPVAVDTFLLTSQTDPNEIASQVLRCGTATVQLCDDLSPEARRELRGLLPNTRLVQVVHVAGPESVADARRAAESADAVLLDSGRPRAAVRELGGTGRTHDWEVSRRIVAALEVPVYVAGGLRPDNVQEAIRQVRPFGVDICSGVRMDGRLNPDLLTRFMERARSVSRVSRES